MFMQTKKVYFNYYFIKIFKYNLLIPYKIIQNKSSTKMSLKIRNQKLSQFGYVAGIIGFAFFATQIATFDYRKFYKYSTVKHL